MNKKDLTKTIRKEAHKLWKHFADEARIWTDEEMEFKCKGGSQAVRDFINILKEKSIIY